MRLTRRQLLRAGLVTGAGAAIGGPVLLASKGASAQQIDPTTIPQFVTQLFTLPAMPPASPSSPYCFSLAARPVTQQVLPSSYPATPGFAFGAPAVPSTFHAPGYTLNVAADEPSQITWANQLVDSSGNYVPPLLPVDPTLHWTNPPGGTSGRDGTPTFTSTPGPYTGPVPLVVHLHGSHDYEENDGYPEAWWLPVAKNIPSGYATVGSFYDQFKEEAADNYGVIWQPGTSIYSFANDQRATQLWYHDHSLGMTRTNVRAGLAGMYLIHGGSSDLPPGVLPGPGPQLGDPPGTQYYEYELIFQDATFNTDGTLYMPSTNTFSSGPYIPTTDIPPIWNEVFLGNTIAVNGNTWPYLNVQPRRYRFRMLNSCGIRPLVLKIVSDPTDTPPVTPALPIWVIGSDGGFLPAPANLGDNGLQILTSERYDIIVDFTGIAPGTDLYMSNEGGGSTVGTTGSVMQFRVVPLTSTDTSTPPADLTLPGFQTITAPVTNTRQVSFNEQASTFDSSVIARFLGGTVNSDGTANPLDWAAPITENPALNATEIWEIYNFATGGHDFHVHLVQFQVQGRTPIGGGSTSPPAPYEVGDKDSVSAPAGQITTIKATFDHQSRFVWHCHFLDHEDNDMMRPYQVG
jgi:spore coat protein A, manganese oxidase